MNTQRSQLDAQFSPARAIRVVIVDDSPTASAALVKLLQELPALQVAGRAEDGLQGFALAADLRPDLVITDLRMPRLDGFQLVELLRNNYPAIRSIVVSAHDGPTLQAVSLRRGADAFISKERLPNELPAVLDRLFPETA